LIFTNPGWFAVDAEFDDINSLAPVPPPGAPKGASLQVLRHSHTSLLLANGVDLATVSERLGHSSVRTTARTSAATQSAARTTPPPSAGMTSCSACRELQGRKLKSVMARKAGDDLDPNRDSELKHELLVARYLAWAFVAQSHGIGMDYARKKYADVPVGAFWVDIARQVIAHMSKRGGQSHLVATIQ
jgi:hypothetical protein